MQNLVAQLMQTLGAYLPGLVGAVLILVVGWLVASAALVGLGFLQRRFDRQDSMTLTNQLSS